MASLHHHGVQTAPHLPNWVTALIDLGLTLKHRRARIALTPHAAAQPHLAALLAVGTCHCAHRCWYTPLPFLIKPELLIDHRALSSAFATLWRHRGCAMLHAGAVALLSRWRILQAWSRLEDAARECEGLIRAGERFEEEAARTAVVTWRWVNQEILVRECCLAESAEFAASTGLAKGWDKLHRQLILFMEMNSYELPGSSQRTNNTKK